MSCAVYSCIYHSFLHLYLQFYYVSVAVTLFRVHSTWYGVRGPHNFPGALVAQQPLPSLVLKSVVAQLIVVQTVRTVQAVV